jgi:hypothetical protein
MMVVTVLLSIPGHIKHQRSCVYVILAPGLELGVYSERIAIMSVDRQKTGDGREPYQPRDHI